jgi:hypothetical protein
MFVGCNAVEFGGCLPVFRGKVGMRYDIPEGSHFLRHRHEKIKLERTFYLLCPKEVKRLIYDAGD